MNQPLCFSSQVSQLNGKVQFHEITAVGSCIVLHELGEEFALKMAR